MLIIITSQIEIWMSESECCSLVTVLTESSASYLRTLLRVEGTG